MQQPAMFYYLAGDQLTTVDKVPTIKEIAKRLNVSVSTVSRALSNHPRIGLGTRLKVQQLAKELNYEPNTQAIFFKQKRTFVIGVIVPNIREDFFSQALSGIESVALQHDYTILFGQSYDELNREIKVLDAMRKKRVDGLIISLSKQTNKYDHLVALDKYKIPVVYFDRVPALPHINKVYCNLYTGTVELIGWLFDNGYKRIALLNGPAKLLASKDRLNGYIEGISKHKLKVDMQMVESTDFSKESTCSAMEKLLALKKRPQAIIAFNDYVLMDAVQYATKHGIAVNKDIAFASYANLPITGYTAFPPLASVEQYPLQQGEKSMELLIQLISNKINDDPAPEPIVEEIASTLVTLA
ncbi:LacI family DNA-binding transcriptional regulator [Ferruginibacter sp.]